MGEPIKTVGELAGICGHDGSNWIKALIDATGHLQIDVVDSGGADLKDILDKLADILTELNAKVETADLDLDASGRLSGNAHHYDGSAWRKSNLLWGYHDSYIESDDTTSDGSSPTTVALTAVPEGEVWVIAHFSGYHNDAAARDVKYQAVQGSDIILMKHDASLAADTRLMWDGEIVLKEGGYVRALGVSITSGKTVYFQAMGYKMDVSM